METPHVGRGREYAQFEKGGLAIPQFDEIELTDIPPHVASELEYLLSSGTEGRDIDREVVQVKNPNDSMTYLYVEKDRANGACFGDAVDELRGSIVGHTSFTNTDDSERKIYSVAFSGTEAEFRGEGFGERRLRIINEYCKEKYGTSLCSDAERQPSAEGLWQKLVANGAAVERSTEGGTRYCFL